MENEKESYHELGHFCVLSRWMFAKSSRRRRKEEADGETRRLREDKKRNGGI